MKEEVVILGPDEEKPTLGWTVREYMGTEVYLAPSLFLLLLREVPNDIALRFQLLTIRGGHLSGAHVRYYH